MKTKITFFQTPSSDHNSFIPTIPVINMNDFLTNRHKFIHNLKEAFIKVGFVGIENTVVQQEMLTGVYTAAKNFFDLDASQKKEITSLTNSGERGYVGTSESPVGKDITVKDKKEFVHFGRELTLEKQQLLGYPQNIWPAQVNLKDPVMTLYDNFSNLVEPLSVAIEEAVGAPENYVRKMFHEGDHLFRIIKYPKTLQPKEEGAASHTDSNFFTILPPATSQGLEVLLNDQWLPVVVPPKAVIVNVGSMLEHMTNGLFHAAVHRVIKYQDVEDRYAIAYFVHSHENDPMTPLPSCIELTGGQQKYPSATRQELLDQRLIAMDRATPDKIQKYAMSGLLQRWQSYLTPADSRKDLKMELQKVKDTLERTCTLKLSL